MCLQAPRLSVLVLTRTSKYDLMGIIRRGIRGSDCDQQLIDYDPVSTREGYANEARPQHQENIMHDRLFPRAAAIVAKGLFAVPLLVPTLIWSRSQSRRGVHRDARS